MISTMPPIIGDNFGRHPSHIITLYVKWIVFRYHTKVIHEQYSTIHRLISRYWCVFSIIAPSSTLHWFSPSMSVYAQARSQHSNSLLQMPASAASRKCASVARSEVTPEQSEALSLARWWKWGQDDKKGIQSMWQWLLIPHPTPLPPINVRLHITQRLPKHITHTSHSHSDSSCCNHAKSTSVDWPAFVFLSILPPPHWPPRLLPELPLSRLTPPTHL